MKKADLKTGDIIIDTEGNYCCVLKDTPDGDVLLGVDDPTYGWNDLDEYDENMEGEDCPEYDIQKVYRNKRFNVARTLSAPIEERELIWERHPAKVEMTLEEIEKALGYAVKVIS